MSRQLSGDLAERFCLEYRKDLNATQAYLRARGPDAKPIKESTAATNGWRMLRNAEVQDRLAQLTQEDADRLRIDAQRVLNELAIVGFSDVRDYVKADQAGILVELADHAHPLASRAISSVKHKTTTRVFGETEVSEDTVEYRLWPKVAALTTLAQHLNLLPRAGGEFPSEPGQRELRVRWMEE